MDRLIPTMEHACSWGLPGYPAPIEEKLRELSDLPESLLTEAELQLLDQWVEARREPVRMAKQKHPENQEAIFRALGWRPRSSRKN